jgi:hypothetical protein
MEKTGQLAGFFAAHAVWCVKDGEPLAPMLGYETPDGRRHMHRVEGASAEIAVQAGRAWLDRNDAGAVRALVLYDGFLSLPTGRTDALVIDIRLYSDPPTQLVVAVPYRHASSADGFAVHKPKVLFVQGPQADLRTFTEAFFSGVASHDEAAPIWLQRFDPSL